MSATNTDNSIVAGRVTIVVPVYNHEHYVIECIESILTQDYPSIELVVINDGSPDSSDRVIRDYLKNHPDAFTYISKENEGLVKTLNLGLSVASGEYFCELASDDLLVPGSIKKRVEFMQAQPQLDAMFADNCLLKDGKATNERFYGGYKTGTGFDSSKHTIADLLTKKARYHIPTGLFKTQQFRNFGGFDPDFRFFEDISIRYLFPLQAKIGFLDEAVIYYRIHEGNISKTQRLVALNEKILGLEKLVDRLTDEPYATLARDTLFRSYLRLARTLLSETGDKRHASETIDKAAAIKPFSPKVWGWRLRLIGA